tara:strand:+ start:59901 stop:61076 length:1176 start_codon:yes stop_codon:yes gene_type:complete
MIKAAPEGLIAAILLSFLSTAGLFYVNLGGAFLSAFVDGLGLSREVAGYVTAANKYGAAFGALLAVFSAGRLPWRKVAYVVLVLIISIDLISMTVNDGNALIAIRFLHGTVGGFLVGTGFSVIARTRTPDRVFGMLLVVQYTCGSIGIMIVPRLVQTMGHGVVFGALIIFSFVTLLMVPFIADYHVEKTDQDVKKAGQFADVLTKPLVIALAAIFFFQAANMGVADYIFELGKDEGLTTNAMSTMVSIANWVAIGGAVLVYVFGIRFGRALPITIGLIISISGTAAFHWSEFPTVYFLANAITGVMWAFLIPYLLGLSAAFDKQGRTAALAGFVSKMGLASGPMAAALLVGEGNFTLILNVAIISLILCGIAAYIPAKLLDKEILNTRIKV